ncbi:MAG: hypothetical protein Q9224_001984 [Gallowayella concinna]
MSAPARRQDLVSLPNELLREIADLLTRRDLKSLSSVCRRLRLFTAPLIFTTATCAVRRGVLEAFKALSDHPQLNQNITKLVYDSSWFDHEIVKQYEKIDEESRAADDHSTTEGREKFIQSYEEQEKILESELASVLQHAISNFSNLQCITYADFSRLSCLRWDRVEYLGPDFRTGYSESPRVKNEASIQYPLIPHLSGNTTLRCRHLGLALLLKQLCRDGSKAQVDDLRLGDGAYSRDFGGIPDVLFMALADGSFGPSTAFDSLRKLDVTFSYCTRRDHANAFLRFRHLELLRLVGPECSPSNAKYAPTLSEPIVRFPSSGGEAAWPKLRALELKWVASTTSDFLAFMNGHKDTLRFANIYECYLDEGDRWRELVSSLRSMYPNLLIEPYQTNIRDDFYDSRIIHFTLYEGQATLVDMGIPSDPHTKVDNYDEGEVSNFYDSDADESLREEERWSSEELDYSEDGDTSDIEGKPVQHTPECTRNANRWKLGTEAFKNCGCGKENETMVDAPTTNEATANELE